MTRSTQATPATDAELSALIAGGAEALGLGLSSKQIDSLVAYIRLIERWNLAYNLTAIRDPRAMAVQHILDCLAVIGPLRRHGWVEPGHRLLDVGSGAGLPGLVIAAIEPTVQVVCVDSVGKKASFILEAVARLGLRNATGLHARVEAMRGSTFDVITSRAFASLASFFDSTKVLLGANGTWLAMKGQRPNVELASLEGIKFHVEPLFVPGLEAKRCLVWAHPEASVNFL